MRIVMVTVALALLTTPCFAQSQTTARSDAQKKSDAEADKAYNTMIKNVPDKPRNTDPWQDVRSTEASASPPAATSPAGGSPTNKNSKAGKHAAAKKPAQ
jgi:hypothetical protein